VAYGKYIETDGSFLGILKGKPDHGRFQFNWMGRDQLLGEMRGRYGDRPTTWVGGWARTSCE